MGDSVKSLAEVEVDNIHLDGGKHMACWLLTTAATSTKAGNSSKTDY